jgi:hypothetical protein
MSTIQCALYCKHGTKYSAQPPVYAVWIVVPDIYTVNTFPHIQTSIFNWTYLRRYSRYVENSMRLILQTWCQYSAHPPVHAMWTCGPGQIQCNYSSAYSGLNIQLTVSALLLEISRQVNAGYNANLVSYIAHTLKFTLSGVWSRPYTM